MDLWWRAVKLPVLLAGPILRRVEPRLVSVWCALQKPGRLRIDIYAGTKDARALGAPTADAAAPSASDVLFRGQSEHTLEVGRALHVAVVTAAPPRSAPLVPGQLYAYNVTFISDDGETDDLRSWLLLEDRGVSVEGELGVVEHRQLPLGYQPHFLPSFALPPQALDELVVVHGSCRRAAADGQDALAYVDTLIERDRVSPARRPHLCVLTGDQIYADDVQPWLMELVNELGREVVSPDEGFPIGLPGQPASTWLRADLDQLPARKRHRVCLDWAGLSSQDVDSHLLSFGEFCAMYLTHFSNRAWHRGLPEIPADTDPLAALDHGGPLNHPQRPELLRIKRFFDPPPSVDPDGEPLAHLVGEGAPPPPPTEASALARARASYFKSYLVQIERLRVFYEALPKVARALANVPVLMLFDDHEITDDWNITFVSTEKIAARVAGRAVLRNGLAAYALFQAWGNDPRGFASTPPRDPEAPDTAPDEAAVAETPEAAVQRLKRREVLDTIAGATVGPQSFGDAAITTLDRLFGLRSATTSEVAWHFAYKGPRWQLIALDTRTRRGFPGPLSPPRLLSEPALREQIPAQPLDPDVEALLVISPVPVIGPTMMDELLQPLLFRILSMKGAITGDPNTYLERDPESWALDPVGLEATLARLEHYAAGKPVLFLSGDVHYSVTTYLDYFRGARRSRFVQLTSSALKNLNSLAGLASLPVGQRALTGALRPARLGWDEPRPQPFTVPTHSRVPSAQLRHINRTPMLLSAAGWPAGTRVTRPADWSWQYHQVVDTRPDHSAAPETEERRPDLGVPVPTQDLPVAAGRDDFRRVARTHGEIAGRLAPRRVIFPSTLGIIRFTRDDDGVPSVRHELMYLPLGAPPGKEAQLYTVHVVSLAVPDEVTPPTLGASE